MIGWCKNSSRRNRKSTAPNSRCPSIQQLAVVSVGQVVSSGQSLLTIVPLDGAIEIEAMIANKDIGFVEPGQPAIVKVEAFPLTLYGTIDATVAKVSRDCG